MQSGNRDIIYRYGKNGELLKATDNSQRLEVSYEYDSRGREIRRTYGNGVRQETLYDQIGRTVLIRETDSGGGLLRAEGYVYDEKGRRSHSVDEEGRVTKYEYDKQSRLSTVLYPWTKEKAEADRKEAEEAGLFFTADKGNGERYSFSAAEQAALREILNKAGPMRGNAVAGSQMMWRESYAYDKNGNRASKATPWGTIKYEYDAENRLVRKGDIVYTNDKDGNTLGEKGLRYEASYQYNGQNRMVNSVVTSQVEKAHVVSNYAYDALGRRTITEDVTGQTLRTLYDGKGFEAIREGETFLDGSFTTRHAPGEAASNAQSNQATGERYRWVGDNESARTRTPDDGYTVQSSRYNGRGVTLYGNGEAVAVSYSSNGSSRSMYMGKDVMGSVRSVTVDTGTLEDRYEYDAFGEPYKGDLTGGMNLGYTGKPYDTATGLYNYGYRDYKPQAARFTTVDPIRDGNNWYAYVNNDLVNWVDLWGLKTVDLKDDNLNKFMNLKFVDAAMKLIGPESYVWGGKNPNTAGGTDCSGTVEWSAIQASGVSMRTRSADEQAKDIKLTTTGDGSFGTLNYYDWDGDGKYDHVTISLGNGTEINPYGGKANDRDNPGPIKIMDNHVLTGKETMVNLQLNWQYILYE